MGKWLAKSEMQMMPVVRTFGFDLLLATHLSMRSWHGSLLLLCAWEQNSRWDPSKHLAPVWRRFTPLRFGSKQIWLISPSQWGGITMLFSNIHATWNNFNHLGFGVILFFFFVQFALLFNRRHGFWWASLLSSPNRSVWSSTASNITWSCCLCVSVSVRDLLIRSLRRKGSVMRFQIHYKTLHLTLTAKLTVHHVVICHSKHGGIEYRVVRQH